MVGVSAATFGGFIRKLRLALLPLMTVAITFLVIEVDDTIYSKFTSIITLGTGFIMTTIGMIIWIVGLGFDVDQRIDDQSSAYSSDMTKSEASPQMKELNDERPHSINFAQLGYYSSLIQNPNYIYKARTIYSYEASSSDPNEISFAKDEVLDIVDIKGKWWQARRIDGTVGIVPSNYLRII